MPSTPRMPREMSWLSPKRRKTTGNLKNVTNGQTNGEQSTPETPVGAKTPGAPERPPTTPTQSRPLSQPVLPSVSKSVDATPTDGNLFYAYAKKGEDVKHRYLLTFASASIANEWWLLLQTHFPECSRPGPQLFSFQDPELLQKAWKHPTFAHLKSKWMYISFNDTEKNGLGGAAQGIIPVQDADGNLLGGSAPASPELIGQAVGIGREVKKETKGMRNEMNRLEEHFEKMLEAVERNTQQIAHLAEGQQQRNSVEQPRENGGYFDMTELSSHLGRINDLLARNSEHVEGLARRQHESEEKLQSALQDVLSRQRNDYLDMSQLSAHLDRIQSLMEQTASERKDSARSFVEMQRQPPQIDFSPLTDKLEKVQEAVEQNSALIKALLDEGTAESKPGTPFWGKETPVLQQPQIDLSPLQKHLQKIHEAIEQQSNHMSALVSFASGGSEDGEVPAAGNGGGDTGERSLAPLGEHLEQIYNAIEQGNKHAKSRPEVDLKPLAEKMEATRAAVSENRGFDLGPLIEKFDGLAEHLEGARKGTETSNERLQQLLDAQRETKAAISDGATVDLGPLQSKFDDLSEHLRKLHDGSKQSNDNLRQMLEAQKELHDTMKSQASEQTNLEPLESKFDRLSEHVQALREPSNDSNTWLKQLVESQDKLREVVLESGQASAAPLEANFRGLIEHLATIDGRAEKNNESLRQLIDGQERLRNAFIEYNAPVGDFGSVAEKLDGVNQHLESLREWAEFDSEQIKELVETQKSALEAAQAGKEVNFEPVTNGLGELQQHLEHLLENSTGHATQMEELIEAHKASREPHIDFQPVLDHLEAIGTSIEDHGEQIRATLEAQKSTQSASSNEIDFTPLTERLNRIHATLERQEGKRTDSPGSGDPKFIMSALTSHLSKIQAVTEANANHVKNLQSRHSSTQDKMHIGITQTADQVRALTEHQNNSQATNDARFDAVGGQVRELMTGQREMVNVMRELATSITAQQKGACDHVVMPPPRKVGRKVVGFVYDVKDGPA